MHKLSVYVETSVWSQALAEDAPDIRRATERFLDEAREGKYDLFVSDVVMNEIARASEETSQRLRGLVVEIDPIFLELNEESTSLSHEFLRVGAVPPSKVDDARHVAVALTNGMDALVSWNYRHLVNIRRRELFHQVAVANGYYRSLQIVTPPEVSDVAQ
jgi:predicted nucleic acid-binding protein